MRQLLMVVNAWIIAVGYIFWSVFVYFCLGGRNEFESRKKSKRRKK